MTSWARPAGIDAFAEKKAAAEAAARLKTLGELVPIYLGVRGKGDQKWEPLRPKTLVDFTRYLTTGSCCSALARPTR